MTVLENFIAFANALSADKRESVEQSLAALMESMSAKFDFTPDELAELDQRASDPEPQFSDSSDITQIFGKPFRA